MLTVGTFLPLVGVLVMLFIPAAEETLHKQIAIVTSGATLAVGIWTLAVFDYDQSEKLQFAVDEEWIEVIKSELHDRPRRHQPAALHPVDGGHVPGGDLHLGQHARRREPEGVPDADARAPGRHGRLVHRPGPHPVLRLLRDRAAADVLHDRRVGRRAAPVRVAQVLPLHDVRLGADARRVPGRCSSRPAPRASASPT